MTVIKGWWADITCHFKFRPVLLVIALFILFGSVWVGQIIRLIGSREMANTITVTVDEGDSYAMVPLVRLAHAGNISGLELIKDNPKQWRYQNGFISRFFFGVTSEDSSKIKSIVIEIGQKKFEFSGVELFNNWRKIPTNSPGFFIDENSGAAIDLLLEAPPSVRGAQSLIPVRKDFFGSLINWSGDDKLILGPLAASLSPFFIILLAFLLSLGLVSLIRNYSSKNIYIDTTPEKRDYLLFCSVLIAVGLLLVVINGLIFFIYRPNILPIITQAKEIYLSRLMNTFLPKPVEQLQFIVSLLAVPFLIIFSYIFLSRYLKKIDDTKISAYYRYLTPLSILFLFFLTFVGLAMSNFLYIRGSYFYSYYGKLIYPFLLFPVFLLLAFGVEKKQVINKLVGFLSYILVAATLIFLFFFNIYGLVNLSDPYHFDPVFYPSTQIIFGKTILVNLSSLYGLFPIFLKSIFDFVGLSVLHFTIAMAVLVVASFVSILFFLHFNLKNKFIILSSFLSVFFYSYYVTSYVGGGQPGFQYWPIRTIFPCLLILLAPLYFKYKSKALYIFSFFLYSVGVLWNFETNLIVFLAWIFTLIYADCDWHNLEKTAKCALSHVLTGLVSLVTVIGFFVLFNYLQSGQIVHPELFLKYQRLFLSGYFLIPMLPPPHTWNLVVIIYLSGLIYAFKALYNNNLTDRSKVIFLLAALGLGLFSYYTGRSHDFNLVGPSFPAILILAIFTERLLVFVVSQGLKVNGSLILFLFISFFLFSSIPSFFYNSGRLLGGAQLGFSSFLKNEDEPAVHNVQFIKQNTQRGDKILILSSKSYDGIYYGESGTVSVLDLPSASDFFYQGEINTIVNFLDTNTSTPVFVYPASIPLADLEISNVLKNKYTTASSSGYDMLLLESHNK